MIVKIRDATRFKTRERRGGRQRDANKATVAGRPWQLPLIRPSPHAISAQNARSYAPRNLCAAARTATNKTAGSSNQNDESIGDAAELPV
jgi:hypothetical protein